MEDGVTEVRSLLPPLNLNSEDGFKREDNKEKEDGFVSREKVEDENEAKDSGGGIINNFISTLITPLSPRTVKATEHESENGVFKSEQGTSADGEREGVENVGERCLISNFVSKFFRRSENEDVVETEKDKEEEQIIVDEKIKQQKTENEANGSGGGIIHNIVSHLPASIQDTDDAAPTADEATILINSLVRD